MESTVFTHSTCSMDNNCVITQSDKVNKLMSN